MRDNFPEKKMKGNFPANLNQLYNKSLVSQNKKQTHTRSTLGFITKALSNLNSLEPSRQPAPKVKVNIN